MRYTFHYDRGLLCIMRDEGWCLMSLGLCNVFMLIMSELVEVPVNCHKFTPYMYATS